MVAPKPFRLPKGAVHVIHDGYSIDRFAGGSSERWKLQALLTWQIAGRQYVISATALWNDRSVKFAVSDTTKAMKEICKLRYEAVGAAGQAGKIRIIPLEAMAVRYAKGELDAVVK